LELEEKRAAVGFKLRFSIGCQHELVEEFGIEEPGIRLAGLEPISRRSPTVPFEIGH